MSTALGLQLAVPPLGLSNKAKNDSESSQLLVGRRIDRRSASASDAPLYDTDRMKRRPFEGELPAFTLWSEIGEKVFGHGYEVCVHD